MKRGHLKQAHMHTTLGLNVFSPPYARFGKAGKAETQAEACQHRSRARDGASHSQLCADGIEGSGDA